MSEEGIDLSELAEKGCFEPNCPKQPDGVVLNGAGREVGICEEHGREYVEDGAWERYEDLQGWPGEARASTEQSGK